MSKGVSGKVLTLIISLIIAIIALILLWMFLNKMIPTISDWVTDIVIGKIKEIICQIPGVGQIGWVAGPCRV